MGALRERRAEGNTRPGRLADLLASRPEESAEEPDGREVDVTEGEARCGHEPQEEPVGVAPRQAKAVREELVHRVVDERRVVRPRPSRARVDDAVRRAEEEIQDAQLRRAPVPRVARENRDRSGSRHLEPADALLVLERHVGGEGVAGLPRDVVLESIEPAFGVSAHGSPRAARRYLDRAAAPRCQRMAYVLKLASFSRWIGERNSQALRLISTERL